MANRTTMDVESVVRRYYAVVADLSSTEHDLRALLSPDARITEHPNAVTPAGAVRDRAGTVAGFRAGKALLREQSFDVHEVFSAGPRAAVRATWRGVVDVDAGPFRAGQELVAHVAALLTVRDGVVVDHETFDCYEPFTAAQAAS
ncbi:nuclear transport factor 2 family protein [Dactylosporangium vinaceum]|uniref:Nuclear transport factor 2 family protein n=1 Tax=Dactylosporangium vinaceum TaxID=53362 RepID=A0ABV5M9N9_9ACTN|nr:nuclear transport factor 2 family protein [Dactylosporangium vinaceum]UAC00085.1 nuclear transport factor 2 family protein [Dactylosporangium vinaceum]